MRPSQLSVDVAQSWRRRALDWLPSPCPACGESTRGRALCPDCFSALPWNHCACPRCALPLPEPALACGRCIRRAPPQTMTLAPLRYAEPVDNLLTAFKFGQQLAVGRVLSDLVLTAPGVDALFSGVTLAVPIPLHRQRLRERGYNQALELLRPIARQHQTAVALNALTRIRPTTAQTGLDGAARRRNLRQAFGADELQLRDQCVLLLDDVITTGTTVAEAARTLLDGGAREVRVLAAARVAR